MQAFLLLTTSIIWCSGQDIRPHILCNDRSARVEPGRAGLLQHTPKINQRDCFLRIHGFLNNSYISIPEISRVQSGDCMLKRRLIINNENYCILGYQSANNTIVRAPIGILNIRILSTALEFLLHYYSTTVLCGDDLRLPRGADVPYLSGVIVSTYTPNQLTPKGHCETSLLNVPTNATVQFELLNLQGSSVKIGIGEGEFISSDHAGSKISVPAGQQMTLRFVQLDPHDSIAFVILFTVLVCGDVPKVEHARVLGAPTPWFLGSKIEYGCIEQWKIKKATKTMECKLKDNKEGVEWVADSDNEVECVPEAKCHSPPPLVDNAEYKLSADNFSATYECTEGFSANRHGSDLVAKCSSVNVNTEPWTWSSPNFICSQVECPVPRYYEDLKHGSVEKKKYRSGDVLSYTCHPKYESGFLVVCSPQGTWSVTPSCVLKPSSISKPTISGIVLTIFGAALTLFGVITLLQRLKKKCADTNPDPPALPIANPSDPPPRYDDPTAVCGKFNNIEKPEPSPGPINRFPNPPVCKNFNNIEKRSEPSPGPTNRFPNPTVVRGEECLAHLKTRGDSFVGHRLSSDATRDYSSSNFAELPAERQDPSGQERESGNVNLPAKGLVPKAGNEALKYVRDRTF